MLLSVTPHRGAGGKLDVLGLSGPRSETDLAVRKVVDDVIRMPVHHRAVSWSKARFEEANPIVLEQCCVDVRRYLHRISWHKSLLGAW
jgi:hypothetical protein